MDNLVDGEGMIQGMIPGNYEALEADFLTRYSNGEIPTENLIPEVLDFINSNIDINFRDITGRSALILIIESAMKEFSKNNAIMEPNLKAIELLFNNGADSVGLSSSEAYYENLGFINKIKFQYDITRANEDAYMTYGPNHKIPYVDYTWDAGHSYLWGKDYRWEGPGFRFRYIPLYILDGSNGLNGFTYTSYRPCNDLINIIQEHNNKLDRVADFMKSSSFWSKTPYVAYTKENIDLLKQAQISERDIKRIWYIHSVGEFEVPKNSSYENAMFYYKNMNPSLLSNVVLYNYNSETNTTTSLTKDVVIKIGEFLSPKDNLSLRLTSKSNFLA